MMTLGPPESYCRRCHAIVDYENVDYHGNFKCHNCGWDGKPDKCAVCKKDIWPKRYEDTGYGASICKRCQTAEAMRQDVEQWEEEGARATFEANFPDENYEDWLDESRMSMADFDTDTTFVLSAMEYPFSVDFEWEEF